MMKSGDLIFKVVLIAVGLSISLNGRSAPAAIPFLDRESQSNIIVHVNALSYDPGPTPEKYTNIISNTNLFSLTDQKLLSEIPSKYKNVTTNSGPLGTVFIRLQLLPVSSVAYFQYTNTDAHEEIAFGKVKSVKFRTGSADGYNVDISMRDGQVLNFCQIRQDLADGVFASFYENHCASWMRFANGKAVGNWFMWGNENTLLIKVEFKEPYDFFKHAHMDWNGHSLDREASK